MKNIKFLFQCVAITFFMILLAETFVVGLYFACEALGLNGGPISQYLNR